MSARTTVPTETGRLDAGPGRAGRPVRSWQNRPWPETLRQVQKRLVEDRVSLSAGSLAYHWFLAFFPAVIALIGAISVVRLSGTTIGHVTHAIGAALPAGVSTVFDAAVKEASARTKASATAIVVGVVVALWSASGGMAALQQALDIAYEVPADRKFLARRMWAVPLMVATALLGGAGAALTVFGAQIGSAIDGHIFVHGLAFVVTWTIVRWVATAILVSLLFSTYFALAPNRRPVWRWVSPGGLLATAVFLAASLGFSFYATKFGSYGKTYGPFAGVAILIFWLYLTGLAILVGAELNAELEREAPTPGVGAPSPVPDTEGASGPA